MTDLSQIAQSLIVRLAAPAQFHSVWVRTKVDDQGEFQRALCVSVRPGYENKVQVPTDHMGVPVVNVPWPEGS